MTDDHTTTAPTDDRDGGRTPDPGTADALGDYAIGLASTDPDAAPPPEVHDALASLFGGARVVGLGEATHGTREFFRLRHRLLRHLVTDHGARTLCLEAALSTGTALDEYVAHGEGDPREALAEDPFWIWETESVLALVEWLREYNADRPPADRVRVHGVDVQYAGGAVAGLEEFLAAVDPAFLDRVSEDLTRADDDGVAPHRDDDPRPRIAAAERVVPRVEKRLAERRDEYAAASSEWACALARRQCRTLAAAAEYRAAMADRSDGDASTAEIERCLRVRDRAMADGVDWAADRSDGPVVVWAHDAHLNRVEQRRRSGDAAATSMGGFLADRHGDDYRAVGFAFGRGSFQAMGPVAPGGDDPEYALREWTVSGPPADTLEAALAAVGDPVALYDLRSARTDDRLAEWLSTPRRHRSVGATYDPTAPDRYLVEYDYATAFDAVCFVAETSRSRPLDD